MSLSPDEYSEDVFSMLNTNGELDFLDNFVEKPSYNLVNEALGSTKSFIPVYDGSHSGDIENAVSDTSECGVTERKQPEDNQIPACEILSRAAVFAQVTSDQLDSTDGLISQLNSASGDISGSRDTFSEILPGEDRIDQTSSNGQDPTGVSVGQESASNTECGILTVPDEPMSKKVMVKRSKNAEYCFNKRARKNEKFDQLR